MTTRGFFVIALLLPLLGGALGFLVPRMAVLGAALLFGGIPYVLVAPVLGFLIRRSTTKGQLVRLSLGTPICFAVLVAAFVGIIGDTGPARELPLHDVMLQLWPFAIYALVFSYAYVALAWLLWGLVRKAGWVRDEFAAT